MLQIAGGILIAVFVIAAILGVLAWLGDQWSR